MIAVQAAYRDASAPAKLRYDGELARWNERAEHLPEIERVHAARSARIAAGKVGLAGMALLVIAGLVDLFVLKRGNAGDLTILFLAIWPAMLIAWHLGKRGARLRLRLAAGAPEPTGDPFADLERLRAEGPAQRQRDLAASGERWSVALPLMALSLIMPLTIHGAVYLLFALVMGRPDALPNFDTWICLSVVIVGHAHFALASFGWYFAKRIHEVRNVNLVEDAQKAARRAFWWTVGISAAPGIVLALLPPLLTAVTGAIFVGWSYRSLAARVRSERELLGDTP